jgi:hypothetical protein
MEARKIHEYMTHSEGLRGYAAIGNKIIFVMGVDCFVEKYTGRPHYTARYFFIDDLDRNIFKTETSLITKVNQESAKVLYERTSATVPRNIKRPSSR